jgi:hypothetical protein
MAKLCKFFIEGKCKKGNECLFKHENNICKEYYFRNCKFGDQCKFKHVENHIQNTKSRLKKLKKINTESFDPSFLPPDAQIIIATPNKKYTTRDIIIAPNLFDNPDEIYEKLLEETKSVEMKLWHGDTHLIADDHINWKSKSPTFNMILNKLAEYFNMNIKASRLNLYKDPTMWKPKHFDAAAVDPKKAETQNITIGVSFGQKRNVCFENAKTKTEIFIPLDNGTTYGFCKDVNIEWRHGIPQEKNIIENKSRFSIIAWGYTDLKIL